MYATIDHLNAQDAEIVYAEIEKLKAEIIESGYLSAEQIDAATAVFNDLNAYNANFVYVSTEILEAMKAQIDQLDVESLKAHFADIDFANITQAAINKLKTNFADIDLANITVAAINNLIAASVDIDFASINEATVNSLKAKYANIDFSNISEAAIKKLFADTGIIDNLEVRDGVIVSGEIVGVTIKGDIIEGGTVKADKLVVLGEDGLYYKLNMTGETVEAEQTDYNSLNGSVITAKSITAEKINVNDLVAFGATIGGYEIGQHDLHSHAKTSALNTVRGVYLNDDGEFSIGDETNFMRYYHDVETDTYKLEITADNMKFSNSEKNLKETFEEIQKDIKDTNDKFKMGIKSIQTQYAQSDSYTVAPTEGWSSNTPVWEDGKYLWTKTVITYNDDSILEDEPVCITGNTGKAGTSIESIEYYYGTTPTQLAPAADDINLPSIPTLDHDHKYLWQKQIFKFTNGNIEDKVVIALIGVYGDDGKGIEIKERKVEYKVSESGTSIPGGEWLVDIPEVPPGQFLWSRTTITYSDETNTVTYSVAYAGLNGQPGLNGEDGMGLLNITEEYYLSSSNTERIGGVWSTTMPDYQEGKFIWMRLKMDWTLDNQTIEKTTYSDPFLAEAINTAQSQIIEIQNSINKWIQYVDTYYTLADNVNNPDALIWTLEKPTGTKGQTIWVRNVIHYNDGTTSELQPIKILDATERTDLYPVVTTGGGDYDFELVDGWYQNTNQKQESTDCVSIFGITVDQECTMILEYTQDCERGYDYLKIQDEVSLSLNTKDQYDGYFEIPLHAGTQMFQITYHKDGSNSNGTDTAKVRFFIDAQKIYSIEEQYALSDSDSSLDNPDWFTAMPKLEDKNKYLWKREKITLTRNNTAGYITYGPYYLVQKSCITLNTIINNLEQALNTTFGSTSNGWEMAFQVLNQRMELFNRYIKFENGNIILGEDESAVTLKIENDIIGFYQWGERVAYLSNGSLQVTEAYIGNQLNLGNFAFVPGKSGNLTFKKIK